MTGRSRELANVPKTCHGTSTSCASMKQTTGGDLNRHVGSTRDGNDWHHGGHGFQTHKNYGSHILDCVEAVTNTFFKKRPTHLITYNSGGRATQIDYCLVQWLDHKLLVNANVIPSNNIDPEASAIDHGCLVEPWSEAESSKDYP
uniref:Uncharacterized protein n=1 Tax=Romanomermis culicivorax TaxID=13658 RepID=A0A915JIE1_ROMCU